MVLCLQQTQLTLSSSFLLQNHLFQEYRTNRIFGLQMSLQGPLIMSARHPTTPALSRSNPECLELDQSTVKVVSCLGWKMGMSPRNFSELSKEGIYLESMKGWLRKSNEIWYTHGWGHGDSMHSTCTHNRYSTLALCSPPILMKILHIIIEHRNHLC